MKNIFTQHPHSIGEGYFQHQRFALLFAFKMILGGLACLMHAIFPFWFEKTGSDFLIKMTHDFVNRLPKPEPRITELANFMQKKMAKLNTHTRK